MSRMRHKLKRCLLKRLHQNEKLWTHFAHSASSNGIRKAAALVTQWLVLRVTLTMGNQTTACAVSPNQLKSVPVWRGKHKNARIATQTLNLSGIVHLSAGSSEHKGAANMTSWPTVAITKTKVWAMGTQNCMRCLTQSAKICHGVAKHSRKCSRRHSNFKFEW